MNSFNFAQLADACARHKVTIPKAARDAHAVTEAATSFRDSIANETAPSLDTITADGLADLHRALVDHEQRSTRLAAADQIKAAAETASVLAWLEIVHDLLKPFGKIFDSNTATFLAAIEELGDTGLDPNAAINAGKSDANRRAREAAATMADLFVVRGVFASILGRVDVGNNELERLSRVLTIPNSDTLTRQIPVRAGQYAEGSAEWWAALAAIPGVRIEWHTPEQQIETTRTTLKRQDGAPMSAAEFRGALV